MDERLLEAFRSYVGVGVSRAARICAAAHGGQIVLSHATAGIEGVDRARQNDATRAPAPESEPRRRWRWLSQMSRSATSKARPRRRQARSR
jgi:class 3 adenylate cyclase